MHVEELEALRPSKETLQVLVGEMYPPQRVISHSAYHPELEGKEVEVILVKKGAGLFEIKNFQGNKEWSALFNHVLKTARVATFLGACLNQEGVTVDLNSMLTAILLSHAGRRQFDEALFYREAVENYKEKIRQGDQRIGEKILREAQVDKKIIDIVKAHGIGVTYSVKKMDTWEKKLSLYADYRVLQNVMSLEDRFADLYNRSLKLKRFTKEQLDEMKKFASSTEQELIRLINFDLESLTDTNPKEPQWEKALRKEYILSAWEDIQKTLEALVRTDHQKIETEVPKDTWWGVLVRELFPQFHPHE
jgi:hypothetical protein